jgi:CRISPR system Cascade subunit CasE
MSSPIYLSRLVPNIRTREARRDLADCVAMHRILMKAFPDGLSSNGAARSQAGLLYRVEATITGAIALLIQSNLPPDWTQLPPSWLHPDSGPQVKEIAEAIGRIDFGSVLRFKLVANPTRKIGSKTGADGRKNNGKRVELRREEEWLDWLARKAGQSGFRLRAVLASAHVPDVLSGRDLRSTGLEKQPDGSSSRLTFYGVAFEGRLEVVDTILFHSCLRAGIGSGKAYGYGLLSLAPGV